jgi:hypothetical protein
MRLWNWMEARFYRNIGRLWLLLVQSGYRDPTELQFSCLASLIAAAPQLGSNTVFILNPHIHALVADSVFLPTETFRCCHRCRKRHFVRRCDTKYCISCVPKVCWIPNSHNACLRYEHLVRYYGYYSNRLRGARRLVEQDAAIDYNAQRPNHPIELPIPQMRR